MKRFSPRKGPSFPTTELSSDVISKDFTSGHETQAMTSVQELPSYCHTNDVQAHVSPTTSKTRTTGSKISSILKRFKTSGPLPSDRSGDDLQVTDGVCLSPQLPPAQSNRDTALAIVKDAVSLDSNKGLTKANEVDCGLVIDQASASSGAQVSNTIKAACPLRAAKYIELPQSQGSLGFAHQLTQNFSLVFGTSTMVHRPSLSRRPDIQPVSLEKGSIPSYESHGTTYIDSVAASSSTYCSHVTRFSISTGAKPMAPKPRTMHSEHQYTDEAKGAEDCVTLGSPTLPKQVAYRGSFQCINGASPTILTVESTANAKIYLETFYDPLLAGSTSPRSLRRRCLESRLNTVSLSNTERQLARQGWIRDENAHLRRLRIQKSKLNCNMSTPRVAAKDFEIIKLLGKGSFGIVRLVREKVPHPGMYRPVVEPSRKANECLSQASFRDLDGLWRQPDFQVQVYAMKVIRKSDMLRNCQEGHLRAERDFLVSAEMSRWVVPLIASFQDNANLYLVMEYMAGGDFLGLLFRENVLKERYARWYIAEMVLCIEETHRRGWIHRDIKPDNFLISASGHLKISDFGLAFDGHWSHDQRFFKDHRKSVMEKLGIEVRGDYQDQVDDANKPFHGCTGPATKVNHRTQDYPPSSVPRCDECILQWRNRNGKRNMAASMVGTSQYMAPEIVRGEPYDGRCDWWSLGIILYECLYGFTPFVCEDRDDTKKRIVVRAALELHILIVSNLIQNHNSFLAFPSGWDSRVSSDAVELIRSLLQDKQHRLCSNKYRLNDAAVALQDPSKLMHKLKAPRGLACRVHFVYPDDAREIKAHRFFGRIAWERHHLTRPPFVPDINGKEDTRYFDDEDPVSDSSMTANGSAVGRTVAAVSRLGNQQGNPMQDQCVDSRHASAHSDSSSIPVTAEPGIRMQPRPKKRPRDKILRDRYVGKQALEVRKKGVFIGYTYRRPQSISHNA